MKLEDIPVLTLEEAEDWVVHIAQGDFVNQNGGVPDLELFVSKDASKAPGQRSVLLGIKVPGLEIHLTLLLGTPEARVFSADCSVIWGINRPAEQQERTGATTEYYNDELRQCVTTYMRYFHALFIVAAELRRHSETPATLDDLLSDKRLNNVPREFMRIVRPDMFRLDLSANPELPSMKELDFVSEGWLCPPPVNLRGPAADDGKDKGRTYRNVFDALADSPAEAELLKFRSALLRSIRNRLDREDWKPSVISNNLGIGPEVASDILQGRLSKLNLDLLISLALKLDMRVDMNVLTRLPNTYVKTELIPTGNPENVTTPGLDELEDVTVKLPRDYVTYLRNVGETHGHALDEMLRNVAMNMRAGEVMAVAQALATAKKNLSPPPAQD